MNEILQRLRRTGTVSAVSMESAGKAIGLANALIAGGIPAAEITFRIQAGREVVRPIAENCPQVLVGAGTILNMGRCQRALSAGAKFIVSLGYDEDLIFYRLGLGVPVVPGCTNASDLGETVTADLEIVKSFPAEQAGGLPILKVLAPVFSRLSFVPTGGISIKNFSEYLGYDRIRLCGGSWMAKNELIEGEQWDKITALCRQVVGTMLNFTPQHVGLPCDNVDAAASTARTICWLFGLEYRQGNTSDPAASLIECCKMELPDAYGHIATETPDVERAEFHLDLQSAEFLEYTRRMDDRGRTKAVYLNQAFAGFAVHLMRK